MNHRFLSLMLILVFLSVSGRPCTAQEGEFFDWANSIVVSTKLSAESGALGTSASNLLISRVNSAFESAGLFAGAVDDLALFRADVGLLPISDNVVASAPARVARLFEFSVVVRNQATGGAFGGFRSEVTGVGNSSPQASMRAVRSIERNDPELMRYVRTVNDSIVRYFNQQCARILEGVDRLIAQNMYEDAIAALSLIPSPASDCYGLATEKLFDLLERRNTQICSTFLRGLQARWAADKSRSSAQAIAAEMGRLQYGLPCDEEVETLIADVRRVIEGYDAQRARRIAENRAFRKKQYEDALAYAQSKEANRQERSLARIEAGRTVGVELARAFARRGDGWLAVFR